AKGRINARARRMAVVRRAPRRRCPLLRLERLPGYALALNSLHSPGQDAGGTSSMSKWPMSAAPTWGTCACNAAAPGVTLAAASRWLTWARLRLVGPAAHEEEAANHAPLSQELIAVARGQRFDAHLVLRGDPALEQERQDRADA